MKTLEEFWQRLRCSDKYCMTMEEVENLEQAILNAKPSDVDYLKVVAYRVLRGFKAFYHQVKEEKEKNLNICCNEKT